MCFSDKIRIKELGLGTARVTMREKKMKKILSVSIVALLAVSPMIAKAGAVDPQPVYNPTAGSNNSTSVVAPYASETINTEDRTGVASAAYVKGAYNAAIRAINKVAEKAADGQNAEQVAAAVIAGINDADGNGLQDDGNGHLSVKNADGTISVTSSGVAVGTITTSNLTGSLATSETTNAVNNKLATQGYVDDVATTAGSAVSAAAAAQSTANAAASAASAAQSTADSAVSAAAAAQSTADSAVSAASAAQSTADSAASAAAAAQSAADAAASAAAAAQSTANGRATHEGVENTIKTATYATSISTPLFVNWGDPAATASSTVVTATTSATSATYAEPL